MLNITAITWYHYNTRYNESLSPEALAKYARPDLTLEALNFGTREEYLQWASEWKAAYKTLSEDIRGYKRARKQASEPYKGRSHFAAIRAAKQLRYEAGAMLFARVESKKRSRELKALRLQIEAQS